MPLNILRNVSYLPMLALTLTPSLAASEPAARPASPAVLLTESQNWGFESEASRLLREIQSLAADLESDASTLESFTRNPLHWHSHAARLSLVREHINAIGKRLERLQSIKYVTTPWQQRAIDDIVAVAVPLAAHTQSAILHLNDNRNNLYAPTHSEHLTTISERSDAMKDTVDSFLDFAGAQQKLKRLQERVGLVAS